MIIYGLTPDLDLYHQVFEPLAPCYSYPITGQAFAEHVLEHPDYDPEGSLAVVDEGEMVGYALVGARTHRINDRDPLTGCILSLIFVRPDRRRRGIGRALLEGVRAFARARGRDLLTNHPNPASPFSFFNGVQEGWQEARAFFAAEGFRITGRSWTCRCDLPAPDPAPEIERRRAHLVAEGYRLEACTDAIAAALLDAAAEHYFYWWADCRSKVERTAFPFLETAFLSLRKDAVHGPGDVTVLHRDGRVDAYVVSARNPGGRIAYFGPVWTRPSLQRQGLGSLVLQEALRRERDEFGTSVVDLWCDEALARGFYIPNGFRIERRWTEWEQRLD